MFILKYLLFIISILSISYGSNNTTLNLTKEEISYLQNNPVIKKCSNPSWAPIEFTKDGDMNNIMGIGVDVFNLVADRLNLKIENVYTKSWSESQTFLKEKKCDILAAAIKTKKREKFALFTDPYLEMPVAIFTTNDKGFVPDISDIIHKPWSRKKGSGAITKMKAKYPDTQVIETKDNIEAFKVVSNGEAYFTIASVPMASYVMSKSLISNLQIAGYTDIKWITRIAVRDDKDILRVILNKALNDISTEEHHLIYKKWVNTTIKEPVADYIYMWYALGFIGIIMFLYIMKIIANKQLAQEVERKTKELSEKNKQLENAQKITKMGSWSLNLTNNELVWSDEIFKIFEIDKNRFKASYDGFLNAIHPDDRDLVNEAYTTSLKDKMPYSIKHRLLMSDGSIKWVKEECETDFDNNGNPLLSSGTVHDITKDIEHENKIKEQEKIIQTQAKIAAVGEMISNIAHQWRQPLSIITINASNIRADYELEGSVSKDIAVSTMDNIQKQAQYLSKTIDDFRNFFIDDSNIRKKVNIKESLEKIDTLVKDSLNNNFITCIKEFEDVYLELNENKLTQVIINIFNNAKDAIVKNNVDNDERVLYITLKKDEQNAIIIIKDSGGGIKKDIIDKIFEPYFTTKHKSIGTGIGLYMSHQIITKHFHGTISVTNSNFEHNGKKLKGAEFIITIPCS